MIFYNLDKIAGEIVKSFFKLSSHFDDRLYNI